MLRLLGIVVAAVLSTSAAAETRMALVVGNGAYRNVETLDNPVHDAVDIGQALADLGFSVEVVEDATRVNLEAALAAFDRELHAAPDAVALFYYSGHGIQVADRNYLIPVDATLTDVNDLDFQTVPIDLVLHILESRARMGLIFLDACRNNPFERSLKRSLGTRGTVVSAGLAAMEATRTHARDGMLIAYSTTPKETASDGSGRNSPFTGALLGTIDMPGLDISDVLRRVRAKVRKETGERQIPWESSSLVADFVFKPVHGAAFQPPPEPPSRPIKPPVVPPRPPADPGGLQARPDPGLTEFYEKAAAKGDLNAMISLASMYFYGLNAPVDYPAAMSWYRRAADHGMTDAMRVIGDMYDKGLGVEVDHQEAIRWYAQARSRGDRQATEILRRREQVPAR